MKGSLKVSKIQKNDTKRFKELIELLNKVFQEPSKVASERQLKKLLDRPSFHAIVVIKEDKVVGGLTAYELERYYTDSSELYIYDIAVKSELHNQGIGKKLIDYIKDYSIENGIEGIFFEAHSEDVQAVKFYESTLGKSEKVDHFNFEIKPQAINDRSSRPNHSS